MSALIDLAGLQFGRLLVLSNVVGRRGAKAKWICRCSCGNEKIVCSGKLRDGRTRSCGCLRRETTAFLARTHGATVNRTWTAEYRAWTSLKTRCNPDYKDRPEYPHYSGRGITVCQRWKDSFADFLADVGPRPSRDYSIDRIDVDGNYEPGNVRWATRSEQAFNTRRSKSYKAKHARAA